jgi:Recombinase
VALLSDAGGHGGDERAKTLERTKRGLVDRAKSGQVNGGRVALGYRYLSGPHQGRLEIHEEEAALICQIFHWALDGCSVRAIARRLTDARVPTATDRRGFTAAEGRKPCKQEPPGVWSLSSVGLILGIETFRRDSHRPPPLRRRRADSLEGIETDQILTSRVSSLPASGRR